MDTPISASAEVKASVSVTPARSQVVLVTSLAVSGLALICSAGLLYLRIDAGWAFFFAAILGGAKTLKFWEKAQSDIDLENSHPTKFELPGGGALSTDTRLLKSPEGLSALTMMIQELLARKPLPEPDGTTDNRGIVIEGSKADAVRRVENLNKQIQCATNQACDSLGLSESDNFSHFETQRSAVESPKEPMPNGMNGPIEANT
ncbi:MAG: hypothetical protein HYU74_09110 [Dechloromonas sp.]|nr:hypothetical protein [Dechloromonas sp.]